MPQNKIKNPFSSMSNKDPNFLKSDLFQFGMDEGIPRNQNVIQNAGMILQDSRTPKTALSPIGLPDLPEPESKTESMPQDDNQSRFLASLLGQGAAMFGGAIAGRDPMKIAEQFSGERLLQDRMAQAREQEQYTRGERELLKQEQSRIRLANEEQRKLAIEQAKNLMNPDSEESKRKRMIYERALGIKIPGEFSASDLEDRNVLQGLVAQSQPKSVPGRVGGGVSQPKEEKKKKLGTEEAKNLFNISMSYNAIQDLKDAVNKNINKISFYGDNEYTESARRFKEGIGRLQSGGAIGGDEEKEFLNLIPTSRDNDKITKRKLEKMEQDLLFKTKLLGFTKNDILYNNEDQLNLEVLPEMTAEDKAMIEEAKKNPNDPDNAEILRTWGIK